MITSAKIVQTAAEILESSSGNNQADNETRIMIKNPLPAYPNFYFNMIRTTINFFLIWPMNNKDKNSFVGSIIN
jgi:hypothetical protein